MSSADGFTLIELLMVITIVAILSVAATPFLSRFYLQTQFDATVERVIGSARLAQFNALDNETSAVWGLCITGNVLRVYQTNCAAPTQSVDYTIPPTITIGGLTNITFSDRGEPSSATTITVTSAIESKQVVINVAGGVSSN